MEGDAGCGRFMKLGELTHQWFLIFKTTSFLSSLMSWIFFNFWRLVKRLKTCTLISCVQHLACCFSREAIFLVLHLFLILLLIVLSLAQKFSLSPNSKSFVSVLEAQLSVHVVRCRRSASWECWNVLFSLKNCKHLNIVHEFVDFKQGYKEVQYSVLHRHNTCLEECVQEACSLMYWNTSEDSLSCQHWLASENYYFRGLKPKATMS